MSNRAYEKKQEFIWSNSLLANKEFVVVYLLLLYHFHQNLYFYNLAQNIWRLFHGLGQFLFTTGDTEQHYHQQKVNVRLVMRLTTYTLRKLGNF